MVKDPKASPKKAVDVKHLEDQVKTLTDQLQRERADSINLRRRTDEERLKLGSLYKAEVVREFLPIIDNLERAVAHKPKELESDKWAGGIEAIGNQVDKILNDLGVSRIKTVGQPFDPRFHEAVSLEDGEGTLEVVCEELQAGYTLNDEVIRHAMVRVKMA